jgi:hypothetical protein
VTRHCAFGQRTPSDGQIIVPDQAPGDWDQVIETIELVRVRTPPLPIWGKPLIPAIVRNARISRRKEVLRRLLLPSLGIGATLNVRKRRQIDL